MQPLRPDKEMRFPLSEGEGRKSRASMLLLTVLNAVLDLLFAEFGLTKCCPSFCILLHFVAVSSSSISVLKY